jgi:hypothetical protein
MAQQIPGARFGSFAGRSHFVGEGDNSRRGDNSGVPHGRPVAPPSTRRLLTILFVDLVRSTERVAELGDLRRRDLLTSLFSEIEIELLSFEGREVDRAGDGLLAVFEGPSKAIRWAQAIGRATTPRTRASRRHPHRGGGGRRGTGTRSSCPHPHVYAGWPSRTKSSSRAPSVTSRRARGSRSIIAASMS